MCGIWLLSGEEKGIKVRAEVRGRDVGMSGGALARRGPD